MYVVANVCQARTLHYWVYGQHSRRLKSYTSRYGASLNQQITTHLWGTLTSGYATVSSANVSHDGRIKENLVEEDELPLPQPSKYPYPTHKQPTPHEIFHLRYGASQAEIKSRYFELVRMHHPDSLHVRRSRIGPHDAHTRFRSIKAAYDFLQGRTLSPHPNSRPAPEPKNFDPYLHELARRRRSSEAARGATRGRASFDDDADSGMGANFGNFDGFGAHPKERGSWNPEGTKERLMLWAGVLTLAAGLFPSFPGMVLTMFYQPTTYIPTQPSTSGPITSNSAATPSPSKPASSAPLSMFSLTPSLDKTHFTAVKALSQARSESREMGVERREGIRNRVKEMTESPSGGAEVAISTATAEKCLDLSNGSTSDPTSTSSSPPPTAPSS